jgi:hypothetical protein
VRFKYTLSTLFLVITVIAACLGYQVRWIHQRHDFLAQVLATAEATWHGVDSPSKRGCIDFCVQQTDDPIPPWPLALFGEKGVSAIYLTIPEKDIRRVIVSIDAYGEYTQPEMDSSQPDFVRAKRLFPEAEIHPIQWSADIPTTSRGFCEIKIVEKK